MPVSVPRRPHLRPGDLGARRLPITSERCCRLLLSAAARACVAVPLPSMVWLLCVVCAQALCVAAVVVYRTGLPIVNREQGRDP